MENLLLHGKTALSGGSEWAKKKRASEWRMNKYNRNNNNSKKSSNRRRRRRRRHRDNQTMAMVFYNEWATEFQHMKSNKLLIFMPLVRGSIGCVWRWQHEKKRRRKTSVTNIFHQFYLWCGRPAKSESVIPSWYSRHLLMVLVVLNKRYLATNMILDSIIDASDKSSSNSATSSTSTKRAHTFSFVSFRFIYEPDYTVFGR